MKIYTSYFSGIKKFKLPIEECVSIALFTPKGIQMNSCSALFPTRSILSDYKNGLIDTETYEKRYREEVLSKLAPEMIAEKLNNKILICYEKPSDFCHRHIIAKWLNESGVASVKEIETAEDYEKQI